MKSTVTAIFCVTMIFCCLSLGGQNTKKFDRFKERTEKKYGRTEEKRNNRYDRFRAKTYYRFERFRSKANDEYAEFMAKSWKKFSPMPPIERKKEPKPDVPPVWIPDGNDIDIPDYEIPFEDIKLDETPIDVPPLVTLPEKPEPVPPPVAPEEVPVTPVEEVLSFTYYGTPCEISADGGYGFSVTDLSEPALAALWTEISDGRFNNMLASCLEAKSALNLCDWAYMQYVEKVAEAYLGTGNEDAVVFLRHFLLTQSGYRTRIARHADLNRLALLAAFDGTVYSFRYIESGGEKFYLLDKSLPTGSFYVYDNPFEDECVLSICPARPLLSDRPSTSRTLLSAAYPEASAPVRTNLNLIDFYNDYPTSSDWDLYGRASLSDEVKSTLYPALRQAIAGKSEKESVEVLLNFVQTSLEYMTDDEQFGYERPLFPDESFYYPYCDCEDRSILFSVLVKDLTGLDVVLLYYPGHLATAVCFNTDVSGDYLIVEGRRFVVCDPTYINASVGMTMPQYRAVAAEVIPVEG